MGSLCCLWECRREQTLALGSAGEPGLVSLPTLQKQPGQKPIAYLYTDAEANYLLNFAVLRLGRQPGEPQLRTEAWSEPK